ncbi:MAG: hypothetical protein ABUS79_11475 [Pseudomonadota bacterium]
MTSEALPVCSCQSRLRWERVDDDAVMQWPVVELAEWEELRRCPICDSVWLAIWPEDVAGGMVFCRPQPSTARRLRDVDRAATLRGYCLARLEEHFGTLDERKVSCRKVGCERKRIGSTGYCVEHLIAQRFGRHLANLEPLPRP